MARWRTPARLSPSATSSIRRKPDPFGDLGEHWLRNQLREARPELALLLAREALDEPLGNQQAEHPVADELQPLVGARAGAGCHRPRDERRPAAERCVSASRSRPGAREVVAEAGLRGREAVARRQVMPVNRRDQRISNGHSQTCHHGAVRVDARRR